MVGSGVLVTVGVGVLVGVGVGVLVGVGVGVGVPFVSTGTATEPGWFTLDKHPAKPSEHMIEIEIHATLINLKYVSAMTHVFVTRAFEKAMM